MMGTKLLLSPTAGSDTQHQSTLASLTGPPDLDPALLALAASHASTQPTPIDPALFAIEQVVNDVNGGRIAPEDIGMGLVTAQREPERDEQQPEPEPEPEPELPQPQPQPHHVALDHTDVNIDIGHVSSVEVADPNHIPLDDDGIDPALREIVNSLTNAQQSHHPNLSGDNDERERLDRERLQHTLQTTLEDFAQGGFGSYGAIFNTNFPQSPNNHNLILPLGAEAEAHTHGGALGHNHNQSDSGSVGGGGGGESSVPAKRGRGRPRGSKNKPKPGLPPPEPAPPVARRPKGRPPKVRTEEELAEIERRKEEKALGIKRKRGRPRKFPELGLVREMRLKKNREAVQEKIRVLEERARLAGTDLDEHGHSQLAGDDGTHMDVEGESSTALREAVALGEQVAAVVARGQVHDDDDDDHDHDEHTDYSAWPYQDGQSLLEAVGGAMGVEVGVGVDRGGLDDVTRVLQQQAEGVLAQGDDEMRGVFSLADVSGHE
ncbi:uncharacterized protein EHS24_005006 [Apiotrichum porosum]|uniref:Uncharacterized protein n=1 Tax=Apiotrichum porosum TaxID=105984 RepID=A0A427Y6M3_9TREE|nr:uncharacterized protein EHS24_005006 [Apiotrichum porosum]RSH86735.1 hypothetical protein EHS24_005006 [Apiotrichum porosum]